MCRQFSFLNNDLPSLFQEDFLKVFKDAEASLRKDPARQPSQATQEALNHLSSSLSQDDFLKVLQECE